MLHSALLVSAIGTPLIVAGAAWLRGGSGALSALVGCAVVIGFFVIGHLGVTAVVGGLPGLSIAGAFVVYLGQLIVLAFVILLLRNAGWLDGRAFAASAIIATVVWQIGQVRGFRKARHEVYPDVTLPTVTS